MLGERSFSRTVLEAAFLAKMLFQPPTLRSLITLLYGCGIKSIAQHFLQESRIANAFLAMRCHHVVKLGVVEELQMVLLLLLENKGRQRTAIAR
ncbi:hypothetical protein CEXT_655511 [Caerostris extrusa]|uniref:Uncharacterized protein n=1 Tax=Caerostris extrusa TaxID=172846 RepID=A0AAV4T4Y6_CAEEX|nr:hypothetical protein CEXT_655511 [Caerostris extrusa]